MQGSMALVAVLLAGFASPVVAGSPDNPMDEFAACKLLQKRKAKEHSMPESGPVGMGWFCDFGSFGDPRDSQWFLIALRSNRVCDGICSNLMGWFAINRGLGTIHSFDVGEQEVGPPIKYRD